MSNRTFILLSIPNDFEDRFAGFVNNVNKINSDTETLIRVEKIYKKTEFAAVPKKEKLDED